jgi:hypothetical protein
LMYKGVIIFYYALESVHHPTIPGIFKYHVYRPDYILPTNIQAELVKPGLAEYSGPLNIEIICPPNMPAVIIEAHLRWNGDNYIWKIKKNKPVLEHILITANGKSAELARLTQSEPHRIPALCAYMRNKIPGEYYYVPVFLNPKSGDAGISELKDSIWEFASSQGWPVIWDSPTGIHQPGSGPLRLCICILKSGDDVARLETFKAQLGVL